MPTETYKQFLIYPGNLFCSLNGNFMFPKTTFTSVEEIKSRIDTYWDEWEQYERKRRDVNLGKAFEILKADVDLHDESSMIEADSFADQVNDYYEAEAWEGRE